MKAIGTQKIRTERLVLRPFKESDAQATYENYGKDPLVNRYISFAPCSSLDGAKSFIQMHIDMYQKDASFYGWAITLDDVVIGSIGLFNVDQENEQCELGYSLGSAWWSQGYATEAAKAILEYAFKEIGAHRVYASHHIDNYASGRLLLRIGMKEEGILRDGQKNMDGSFSDLKLYACLNK